jgi:hypothetical protein
MGKADTKESAETIAKRILTRLSIKRFEIGSCNLFWLRVSSIKYIPLRESVGPLIILSSFDLFLDDFVTLMSGVIFNLQAFTENINPIDLLTTWQKQQKL